MTEEKNVKEVKIEEELGKTVEDIKNSLSEVKSVAIAEVWKILQLLIGKLVRIIEKTAVDWSGAEKKALAMSLLEGVYDKLFSVIDIPMVPSIIEGYLHSYVKKILMILVSSTIDATVTTFRDIGVFVDKYKYQGTQKI